MTTLVNNVSYPYFKSPIVSPEVARRDRPEDRPGLSSKTYLEIASYILSLFWAGIEKIKALSITFGNFFLFGKDGGQGRPSSTTDPLFNHVGVARDASPGATPLTLTRVPPQTTVVDSCRYEINRFAHITTHVLYLAGCAPTFKLSLDQLDVGVSYHGQKVEPRASVTPQFSDFFEPDISDDLCDVLRNSSEPLVQLLAAPSIGSATHLACALIESTHNALSTRVLSIQASSKSPFVKDVWNAFLVSHFMFASPIVVAASTVAGALFQQVNPTQRYGEVVTSHVVNWGKGKAQLHYLVLHSAASVLGGVNARLQEHANRLMEERESIQEIYTLILPSAALFYSSCPQLYPLIGRVLPLACSLSSTFLQDHGRSEQPPKAMWACVARDAPSIITHSMLFAGTSWVCFQSGLTPACSSLLAHQVTRTLAPQLQSNVNYFINTVVKTLDYSPGQRSHNFRILSRFLTKKVSIKAGSSFSDVIVLRFALPFIYFCFLMTAIIPSVDRVQNSNR